MVILCSGLTQNTKEKFAQFIIKKHKNFEDRSFITYANKIVSSLVWSLDHAEVGLGLIELDLYNSLSWS